MKTAHILVVEDDLTTQHVVRVVLEDAGYSVTTADSAEQAIERLGTTLPDLALMDRELPGMDGLELTSRLKRSARTKGMTVLSFSSHVTRADDLMAVAAGCDGFIHKPLDVLGLLRTVAWHLAAREARSSARASIADRPANAGQSNPNEDVRALRSRESRVGSHPSPNGGTMNVARTRSIPRHATSSPASTRTSLPQDSRSGTHCPRPSTPAS